MNCVRVPLCLVGIGPSFNKLEVKVPAMVINWLLTLFWLWHEFNYIIDFFLNLEPYDYQADALATLQLPPRP